MDTKKLFSNLMSLAETFLPIIGGPLGSAAVGAGKALIQTIDDVKASLESDDAALLEAKRDQLEEKVLAHLDSTIDSLD